MELRTVAAVRSGSPRVPLPSSLRAPPARNPTGDVTAPAVRQRSPQQAPRLLRARATRRRRRDRVQV